jgi:hypothetical protein
MQKSFLWGERATEARRSCVVKQSATRAPFRCVKAMMGKALPIGGAFFYSESSAVDWRETDGTLIKLTRLSKYS